MFEIVPGQGPTSYAINGSGVLKSHPVMRSSRSLLVGERPRCHETFTMAVLIFGATIPCPQFFRAVDVAEEVDQTIVIARQVLACEGDSKKNINSTCM